MNCRKAPHTDTSKIQRFVFACLSYHCHFSEGEYHKQMVDFIHKQVATFARLLSQHASLLFTFQKNACEHVATSTQFMASPQCLGYSRYRGVSEDLCFPPKEEVLNRTELVARDIGAKAVFVATDNDPMIEDLRARLQDLGVSSVWFTCWRPSLFTVTMHPLQTLHFCHVELNYMTPYDC